MKRIAIISPCNFPVPSSSSGAVEGLITRIIEDNEKYKKCDIDLFTIAFEENICSGFSNTNLFLVKLPEYIRIIDRVWNKYHRTVQGKSSKRFLDRLIVNTFLNRLNDIDGEYDAVIIENMMSTACELVHSCSGKFDFPIYFHMHNDVDIYRSPEHIRELVRYGVQFISVSEYIKGQILKQDKNAIVTTLYNGVDLSRFNRAKKAGEDNTITLLYAGRIIPGKGVKELVLSFISALKQFGEEEKEGIRLLIVGFSDFDHGYEKEIRTLAREYEKIECLGQVGAEEMSSIYDSADVVIMPTIDEEPFGLVALETMAKGIPLITTNSGAIPEVVADGALIVDKSSEFVKKLTEAIISVVMDREYRKSLSEKAFDRAHQIKEFDLQNYYPSFMEIIDEQKLDSEDLISVIVPVYNVKDFLRRCIFSITSQTYSNLDIIIVDDGSTDDSGTICDEFAQKDRRIKVIHQDNMGLSGARNTGLDNVSGKYIFFCDSDDYLRDTALELMLKKLKKDHADIVACGISHVFDGSKADFDNTERFTSANPGRWSGHESVIQMMRSDNVCTVIPNKLYKRELFEGIRFPLGAKNEDEATTYMLLYKAGLVTYMPDDFYMYYQREVSIMHEDIEHRYQHFLEASLNRIKYFKENGENDLEEHSRITLLEWIKYSYRNIGDNEKKKELLGLYKENINANNAPSVMGKKKKLALLLWKYTQY